MAARPIPLPAQAETPASLDGGRAGEVQTLTVRNPHAETGAYVKLYESAAAPTAGSIPAWAAWVPGAQDRVFAPFVGGAQWWVAVSTEAAAGLTAPASPFVVSATFARA
jgi:hypothetical protein